MQGTQASTSHTVQNPAPGALAPQHPATGPAMALNPGNHPPETAAATANQTLRQHLMNFTVHDDTPPYLRRASEGLRDAIDNLNPNARGDTALQQQKALRKNLQNYLTQASNYLTQAVSNGAAKTDPSIKASTVNVAAGVVSNVAFSVPAAAYTAVLLYSLKHTTEQEATKRAEATFAVGVGAMNTVMSTLADKVKNKFGGTNPTYHIMPGNHSTVGTYQSMVGGLLDAATGTLIYAAVRAGAYDTLSDQGKNADSSDFVRLATAAIGIAMVSAVVMGFAKEAINYGMAKLTNSRNNADTAAQLPLANHNRSFARGVTLNEVKNPLNNLTFGNTKFLTMANDAAAAAVGAAGLYATNLSMRQLDNKDVSQSFEKVAAAFLVFFAMKAVAKMALTRMNNDPGVHASSYIKSSTEILVKELETSSLHELRGALDALATEIENQPADRPSRYDYNLASVTLSGGGTAADFQAMSDRLNYLANSFDGPGGGQDAQQGPGQTGGRRQEAMEMARTLRSVAQSFQNVATFRAENDAQARPLAETYLIDAQRKMYQAQALVVSAQTTAAEGLTPAQMGPLLPMFAALQQQENKAELVLLMTQLTEVKHDAKPENKRFHGLSRVTPNSEKVHMTLARGGIDGLSPKAFAEYANATGQDQGALLRTLDTAMGNIKSQDDFAQARYAIIRNLVAYGQADEMFGFTANPPVDDASTQRARGMVGQLAINLGDKAALKASKEQITRAVLDGEIHVKHLAHAIRLKMANMDQSNIPHSGEALREALGSAQVDLLLKTYPPEQPAARTPDQIAAVHTAALNRAFAAMGEALAHMDGDHKAVFNAAAKLNRVFDQAPIDLIEQKDAHYHPTNYNGVINPLPMLVKHMDAVRITETAAAPIPHQLRHMTPATQYYASVVPEGPVMALIRKVVGLGDTAQFGLRYRSHDEAIQTNLESSQDTVLQRVFPSITGIDMTDPTSIGMDLDKRLFDARRHGIPVPRSVGEVTTDKEIVTRGLHAEKAIVGGEATRTLIRECAMRGLPLLLHCDRSVPGVPNSKNKNADKLLQAMKDVIREFHNPGGQFVADAPQLLRPDPLAEDHLARNPDGGAVQPPKVQICWAHGAGISRFTAESNDHTQRLLDMFRDPVLRDHLFIDLSWDFVAHDILQNVQDLLINSTRDSPPQKAVQGLQRLVNRGPTDADVARNERIQDGVTQLTQAMDGLIKSYKAFSTAGGRADLAQDKEDHALSALHVVAANRIAQTHLNQIAVFKQTVLDVLQDNPDLRNKLVDLVLHHGNQGNNWLHLLHEHSNKIMFGTDALAVGTKAHGEAAYAINAVMLYPIYHLFEGLADSLEAQPAAQPANPGDAAVPMLAANRLRTVVQDVARGTFDRFFNDNEMNARRTAWVDVLERNGGTQWTAGDPANRIAGQNFMREGRTAALAEAAADAAGAAGNQPAGVPPSSASSASSRSSTAQPPAPPPSAASVSSAGSAPRVAPPPSPAAGAQDTTVSDMRTLFEASGTLRRTTRTGSSGRTGSATPAVELQPRNPAEENIRAAALAAASNAPQRRSASALGGLFGAAFKTANANREYDQCCAPRAQSSRSI